MQEPQFSPFEADTLTPAERQALKHARGRRLRALFYGVGAGALALFAVGCPEPADLQDPASFPLPPTGAAGTSSTAGSTGTAGTSSSGAECEVACMATALTTCKVCHSKAVQLVPKLDLQTAGYTALLKNQPAQYSGLMPAMCPTPAAKLIDTAAPANSWFLKKVKNDVGQCGTAMPPPPQTLAPAELKCFEDYVACVSGAAPAASTGGTGTGGTGTAGTATGGSGGTGGT